MGLSSVHKEFDHAAPSPPLLPFSSQGQSITVAKMILLDLLRANPICRNRSQSLTDPSGPMICAFPYLRPHFLLFFFQFSLFPPPWIISCFSTYQGHSCLRNFALMVSSAGERCSFPCIFPHLQFFLNITFLFCFSSVFFFFS